MVGLCAKNLDYYIEGVATSFTYSQLDKMTEEYDYSRFDFFFNVDITI